jgi:hypothetical protein
MELVERVMGIEPYASAQNVYWIVDNGSSHNGQRSIDRMSTAWPNARLVHLPVHASWLNQIEIVFSVIQRKVIKPADFAEPCRSPRSTRAFRRALQRDGTSVRLAFHEQ